MIIPIQSIESRHDTVAEDFPASVGQKPRVEKASKEAHLFNTEAGSHILVVNGSRVYTISDQIAEILEAAQSTGRGEMVSKILARYGLDGHLYVDDAVPAAMTVRTLSLAVAQKCNLACSYCYAQEGGFGNPVMSMADETALASVDRLFADAKPGERVNLAFMGGEPLINRHVIRRATKYASGLAADKDISLNLSITTNGTLLTPEDAIFFERYGFAVTISIDGIGEEHDRQRPFKSGRGSFDQLIERVQPLLVSQSKMQVSARITVTPDNLNLRETLDALISLGFLRVGFSPMLSSPTGRGQMQKADLEVMLQQMIACGKEFEQRVLSQDPYPFTNMMSAMQEIHNGTHRPYSCGGGGHYFGVSAEGHLYACHRFVDEPMGLMGSVAEGVDRERQGKWLQERHVHFQEPCNSCWARYLCGGGCHHEVINRGRPACNYIRGWLNYCLQAYVRLLARRPEFFESTTNILRSS